MSAPAIQVSPQVLGASDAETVSLATDLTSREFERLFLTDMPGVPTLSDADTAD